MFIKIKVSFDNTKYCEYYQKIPVEWKSIQNLKWSQDGLINEIKKYLKEGKLPQRIEEEHGDGKNSIIISHIILTTITYTE